MSVHAPHIAPDLKDRSVLVLGGARSGYAAAELCAANGADVFVSDTGPIREPVKAGLEKLGIGFEENGHTVSPADCDFIVVSPGVPDWATPVVRALAAGIPVISEIELASRFCRAPIVAVTGSNGKTTTTELLGHVFRAAGMTTHVCGNVGTPFSDIAAEAGEDAIVVLEVSSFQLDHVASLRPRASVLLNITPDHLDRYGSDVERYADSKFRIAEFQREDDAFIYNMDDDRIARFVAAGRSRSGAPLMARPYGFTIEDKVRAAGSLREGDLVIRIDSEEETLMQMEELALRGRHNVYNSLAAAIAARVMEVRSDLVRESLRTFEGVPHRLETVREVDGVRYVNDSKATNVNALWYALESYSDPVVLIAGGRDKGNDYGPLKPLVSSRVRALISIGECADVLDQELGPYVGEHLMAETLEDAVTLAHLFARSGDVVLLSPACASFDMFDNYEHRGDVFRRAVSALLGSSAPTIPPAPNGN